MDKCFSLPDLEKLVFPLTAELALALMVGTIEAVMLSGVGESADSGFRLVNTVFQLLIDQVPGCL